MKKKVLKLIINVINTTILLLVLLLMWLTHIMIYDDFYPVSMHIVDYRNLDVFRIFWIGWTIINAIMSTITKKYSKLFYIIHLILAVISCLYLFWILTL